MFPHAPGAASGSLAYAPTRARADSRQPPFCLKSSFRQKGISRVRKNHFAAAGGLFSAISRQTLARYHQYLASAFPNLAENSPPSRRKSLFSTPC